MEQDLAFERLVSKLADLPPDKQHAIIWLIENFDFAVALCKSKSLTPEQRAQYMKHAVQTDDAMLLLLVKLEEMINSDQW